LEVLDEDPVRAKEMADEVLVQLKNVLQKFHHDRGRSRSEAFERQMYFQLARIDSIEKQIAQLSIENNLVEFKSQSRELVKGYVESLSGGKNSEKSKEIQGMIENLEESGAMYESLQNIREIATMEYGSITEKFLEWRAIGYENVHYFDLVVQPEVADRKAWPVRWLIMLLAVVASCVLTLIFLAIRKTN
jgi:uncharacterized protein involved in exopolysaccharide biosynthesis